MRVFNFKSDGDDKTQLMYAVRRGMVGVMEALLPMGVDVHTCGGQ